MYTKSGNVKQLTETTHTEKQNHKKSTDKTQITILKTHLRKLQTLKKTQKKTMIHQLMMTQKIIKLFQTQLKLITTQKKTMKLSYFQLKLQQVTLIWKN